MISLSDSEWRMNAAAVILDDAGNVLLGITPGKKQRMHFPQGGIKPGESPAEAALREVREEVGLRGCRVLAQYAGLRYEYRSKNKKSEHWLGQQQTYCLLRVPGICPPVDCSGSSEFSTACWLPPGELTPELFVPFKREVVAQVLAHFFAGGALRSDCTTRRYLHTPGQSPEATQALIAGGKQEAEYHLAHQPPMRPGKQEKLCVVLLGMQGAGVKKSLRHIAHTLDPLTTRYFTDPRRYESLPAELLPLPGELSLLALPADASSSPLLPPLTRQLHAAGARCLSIGLHLSPEAQAKRLEDKDKHPTLPYPQAVQQLHEALAQAPGTHYMIPADHARYRDYLLHLLLEEFFTGNSGIFSPGN